MRLTVGICAYIGETIHPTMRQLFSYCVDGSERASERDRMEEMERDTVMKMQTHSLTVQQSNDGNGKTNLSGSGSEQLNEQLYNYNRFDCVTVKPGGIHHK